MSKTVIITGASRGVGKELAKRFKAEGYNVLGTYLNSTKGAEELKNLGIEMIRADVSSFEEMNGVFKLAKEKFNKIDLVINNAGVALKQKPVLDVLESEFDLAVSVNLKGVFNGTRLAVSAMLAEGGKIVNISSIFAHYGGSCEAVYTATKAGVIAFTRAVAEELESSQVEICSISLGLIDTDMNGHLSLEDKLGFVSELGLKKIPTAKDTAGKIFNILKKDGLNGKSFKIFCGNFCKKKGF